MDTEKPIDEPELQFADIKKMKEKSTSGGTGKKGAKNIRMTLEAYKKSLARVAAATAAAVILVCSLGSAAFKSIKNNMIINNAARDCRYECIAPETHRTSNNEGYFYDYSRVYGHLVERYGEDVGLYLFYCATNSEHQLDRMVSEGIRGYNDFDDYLRKHNYSSFNEWRNTMRKRTLLEYEDDELHRELDEIKDKHASAKIEFETDSATPDRTEKPNGGMQL